MELKLNENLIKFSRTLKSPLYVVGGAVRNMLLNGTADDVDLCAAISAEDFSCALKNFGFIINAVYPRTGTVNFSDGKQNYEYTAFRKEEYADGGTHSPIRTEFCEDIKEDALRRDFKCNAVYYDLAKGEIVDPLGGVEDIKNNVLDTVKQAEKVFCSDGLRLLRLARFAGELNFKPTENVLLAMQKYADNITDISPERIYSELNKILHADKKYAFSDPSGHYTALKILDQTRVLDRILPELTAGRGMAQRADFHKYDVLEHSLRCVLYAEDGVRLASLLHDVGKPYCMNRYGKYYLHFSKGVNIADKILNRLKADKKTTERVKSLIYTHMVDLDCSMRESKVREFIVLNRELLDDLIAVKQTDFRASLETEEVCPTILKWNSIISKMKKDGTPFSLKQLKITAKELEKIGFNGQGLGEELKRLFLLAVKDPTVNENSRLIKLATARKLKLDSFSKV